MPGEYVKNPEIYGNISSNKQLTAVGFNIGKTSGEACNNPEQFSNIDSQGYFRVQKIKGTRIFASPVPASCAYTINACFKDSESNTYLWSKEIIDDCNSLYLDYKLSCEILNNNLQCNEESIFKNET